MEILSEYFIAIDGQDPDGSKRGLYEQQTAALVRQIKRWDTGKALLLALRNKRSQWVLIKPKDPSICNAGTSWTNGVVMFSDPSRSFLYGPDPNAWPLYIGATVSFSADAFVGDCAKKPTNLPDEVLLHELVHAQRMCQGILDRLPLTNSLKGFRDEEDFFAVLVTNVYTSETGREKSLLPHPLQKRFLTRLSADHSPDLALFTWDTDESLMSNPDYYRLVKKYWDQLPQLSAALAKVKANFNPFKVYEQWKARNFVPEGA